MIVGIDDETYDLADLPDDPKAAKMRVQQMLFRGDVDWYPLVGGGKAFIDWQQARLVVVGGTVAELVAADR